MADSRIVNLVADIDSRLIVLENDPPGSGIPDGGTTGQVLAKASDSDGDAEWTTVAGTGTVTTSGTPVVNDFAKFTDATTIEGRSYAETRSDLGLVIGTNVQAWSANLDEYAAVNPTAAGLALLDDADASAQRTTLGVAIGTNVQAYSANLDEYAAVNPTAAGLALLDDADASAQRTTLGVAIGTNVQAYSANLDEYAAVNPTAAGLALLDDADAAAQRTTLGLDTTANQTDSANKRFMTDAQETKLDAITGTNTGDQNIFSTIAVSGQSNVVADSTSDTLTLAAGSNITITTDAGTDTVTIAATGGGGTVDISGTPTAGQTAVWTDANTLEGVTPTDLSSVATKNPPVDADTALIFDSAASDAPKRLTWANSKLAVRTYLDTLTVLTDGANIATDCSLGKRFRVTLAGNRTLDNPTNPSDGVQYVWEFIQDATGSRTITLGSKFAFGTDITGLTLTTTASKRDFMTAIYNTAADKFYVVGVSKGY